MKNLFKNIILISLSISVANAIEDTNKLDDYLSRTSATITYSLKHDDSTTSNSISTIQPLLQQNNDAVFITGQLSSSTTKYEVGIGYRKIIDDSIIGVKVLLGRDYNTYDNSYEHNAKTND